MEIEVEPGAIIINSIIREADHEDIYAFTADLKSKYPGDVYYYSSEDEIGVYIQATNSTLYQNEDEDKLEELTRIGFKFKDAHEWRITAHAARYTVYITMWDMANECEQVWPKP